MNILYEIVKPIRKENRYEGDNWFEKWANFSPMGIIGTFSLGYISFFGLIVGWCLATGI